MRRTTLAALALLAPLAACGGEEATPADDDRPYTDADVAFATEMVQHHAQALLMVDLTVQRDVSPELAALAESIRTSQAAEIETMVDWLEEWGEEVPETDRDHANAHGDGAHDDDLAELESLQGTEFEEEWLDLMADHHEDAVDMAEDHVQDGEWPAAVELAEQVAETQQAEVEQMERMQDRL
jgi:uncharacterized protein (DUF305 family)